jgi:Rrf2 family protein
MRIAQTTALAIDSLLYMAAHNGRDEFAVEEIAQAQQASPAYLAKVFQRLAKSDLLRSRRGAKGGYSLARPPAQITLLDIAQVFEGAAPMYGCRARARACGAACPCLVPKTFREVEEKFNEILRGVSLEDMAGALREHCPQSWCGAGAAN